jgi:hypothetical protein
MLPRELAEQAVAMLAENGGSQTKAAKAMGLARTTFQARLETAARYGLLPFDPVMPSFKIGRVVNGPHGTSVTQVPDGGPQFEVPEGHRVKGVSALVDRDGQEVVKWIKTTADQISDEALSDAVRAAFDDYKPAKHKAPARATRDETIAVYPLPDWHIGLLAWEEETGGNYDLNIARDTLSSAMRGLIEATPASSRALILGLGDLLHFDGYEPKTERSGNVLDADGRYPKVLREAVRLVRMTIDMALAKHEFVDVRLLAGNHDRRAALAVALALGIGYEGSDRVSVDDSPSYMWAKRYGRVLLGATHGDKAKMNDMPLIMATDNPTDWAASTRRRIFTGHIHHERLREIGGVIVESLRSPVGRDAWHSFEGYRAGRSVYSYTFWLDGSRSAKMEFEL